MGLVDAIQVKSLAYLCGHLEYSSVCRSIYGSEEDNILSEWVDVQTVFNMCRKTYKPCKRWKHQSFVGIVPSSSFHMSLMWKFNHTVYMLGHFVHPTSNIECFKKTRGIRNRYIFWGFEGWLFYFFCINQHTYPNQNSSDHFSIKKVHTRILEIF